MKRTLIYLTAVAMVMAIGFNSCKKKEVKVTEVTVTPATVTLKPSDTQQLTATVLPADAGNKEVTWSSSNTANAAVNDKGLVTIPTNAQAGNVIITVTTVSGGKTANCTITVNIPDFEVAIASGTYTYSDEEIKPNVTVKAGATTLTAADYDLVYEDNINAGTAKVTANGKGSTYAGKSGSATFTIEPLSTTFTVTVNGTYTYKGAAHEPGVTVKWGEKPLTIDTDYTLAYSNNTNAGTATVTAKGKGNFTNSSTGSNNFTIAKFPITVTADNKERSYWDIDPELTYTTTPATLFNSDKLSGTLKRIAGTIEGKYDIEQGDLGIVGNYEITSFTKGEFEIYYFRGEGTESEPYEISTAAQLRGWANDYVNKVNNPTYNSSGICYKLTSNINLNNAAWTPIGNISSTFKGNFDGNGKIVSGLYINDDYLLGAGLFGVIDGGTVQNLGVMGTVSGNKEVGGVAGYLDNGGSITNCYSAVDVSGNWYAGGIVGYVGTGNVTNCYTTGAISGDQEVGGVVGSGGIVTYCYATGTVSGSLEVGGVSGSSVDYCAALNLSITNTGFGNYFGRVSGTGAPTDCVAFIDTEAVGFSFDGDEKDGTLIEKADVKTQDTYVDIGWEFGEGKPWKWGGTSYPLPVLNWQETSTYPTLPTHINN